jgi:hypothetical protein
MLPRMKATGERTYTMKSQTHQLACHPGGRCFVRACAVDNRLTSSELLLALQEIFEQDGSRNNAVPRTAGTWPRVDKNDDHTRFAQTVAPRSAAPPFVPRAERSLNLSKE